MRNRIWSGWVTLFLNLRSPSSALQSPIFVPPATQKNTDLHENPNGEDDHVGGRILRHHRQREGQYPGQRRHPAGPAAPHLRRKTARIRQNPSGLQHPEGVDSASGSQASRWPKKIKYKHKKVKLSVLQFYKMDDSGKVQRLRKKCPKAEYGAGTFMANHFDRHYCGKCGLLMFTRRLKSLFDLVY